MKALSGLEYVLKKAQVLLSLYVLLSVYSLLCTSFKGQCISMEAMQSHIISLAVK